jgi:hypothetical protein
MKGRTKMYYAVRFSEKERLSITDKDNVNGKVFYSNKDEKVVEVFIKGFTLKGNINTNEFSAKDNNGNLYTFIIFNGKWHLFRYKLANCRFMSELPLGDPNENSIFYLRG